MSFKSVFYYPLSLPVDFKDNEQVINIFQVQIGLEIPAVTKESGEFISPHCLKFSLNMEKRWYFIFISLFPLFS